MRICAVTGSRADWGLLRPVLHRLRESPATLQLIATGSHLDQAFGHTIDAIIEDGFTPDARVPLRRSDDGATGIATAMADALEGITSALLRLQPELLLVLGDRFEIFASVQAAMAADIPVAHIAGGDISEGANDDAMRHAISKLSHLHFTTNADARRRVLQMGEQKDRVFNTGSPGIDALLTQARWSREQLEQRLDFTLRQRNLAVTFHAATLDPMPAARQINTLLSALTELDNDIGLVFTGANADSGGAEINAAIVEFVETRDNACSVASLGQAGYYSLLEQADLVVGNSSSGLYEAPSLHTPTLDIGIRQQGRLRGPSVHHVACDTAMIRTAIDELLSRPPSDYSTPYGDGRASERIVDVLLAVNDPRALLIKHFAEFET